MTTTTITCTFVCVFVKKHAHSLCCLACLLVWPCACAPFSVRLIPTPYTHGSDKIDWLGDWNKPQDVGGKTGWTAEEEAEFAAAYDKGGSGRLFRGVRGFVVCGYVGGGCGCVSIYHVSYIQGDAAQRRALRMGELMTTIHKTYSQAFPFDRQTYPPTAGSKKGSKKRPQQQRAADGDGDEEEDGDGRVSMLVYMGAVPAAR